MHQQDQRTEVLTQAILRYAVERIRMNPPTLDGPKSEQDLRAMVGQTITANGLGGLEALRIFTDVLAPACISVDHPRFFSFVPAAPTEAATLFDLVVGASSICGTSWLEAAGAVMAENDALRWLADLAGFPPDAGGVFVSGGTAGNLSALITARSVWREASGQNQTRGLILTADGAHASVQQAAFVMDADILAVPCSGTMTGADLEQAATSLPASDRDRIFAVVATSGTTNLGLIDDLSSIAEFCRESSIWLHVDGAYGAAALAAPSARGLFDGIEQADSFIVDPHKWLFAPLDCCALIYRAPEHARVAHRQHGDYLEVLYDGIWNPSDYAHHLSRRARGLPFWFSLATHGTAAYADAVEKTLALTQTAATLIDASPWCERILPPNLSIVIFKRKGWTEEDYARWSQELLETGEGFVMPTKYQGETVLRFCIVNPTTTEDDITLVLDTLAPEVQ
ncbi:MAG: pyridoxal phosphate-dependent decarboxylase family protein [Candidatus Azotimanducaceae bacterium]